MAELLQFPFARGMDEGSDPKGLPAGAVLSLENRYHDKHGRLVKRPGVDALPSTIVSGGSVAAGVRLLRCGYLAMFDGEKLYTFASSVEKWQAVDRPPALVARKRPLIDCTRSVRAADVAIAGDLLVTFYETGTSGTNYLYAEARNRTTGDVVMPATYVATGSRPRVVVNDAEDTAYLFWGTSGGSIYIGTLTIATLSVTVQTTLTTSSADGIFDAIVPSVTGADRIYLIYCLASGASRIRVESFNTSSYATVDSVTVAGTTMSFCCLATDGTYIHAAYNKSSAADQCILTTSMALGSAVGPTTVDSTLGGERGCFVAAYSATQLLVGWARDDGAQTSGCRLYTQLYTVAAHAAVSGSQRITYGATMPSKPWTLGGRWYTAVSTYFFPYSLIDYSAIPSMSVVVLEIETAASLTGTSGGTHPHVATLENQTGWQQLAYVVPKTATDADGNIYVPAPYRNREPLHAWATVAVGFNLYTIVAADETWGQVATIADGALCSAGAPFWWDGAQAQPYGFVHAPLILSAGDTAGGSMTAGTYGYLSHYGWRDSNGMLHRSPVSPSKSEATAGGNLSVALNVSSSSISSKQRASFGTASASPAWVMLYRTERNGSLYYQLMLEPQTSVLFNDPQIDDVSMTDTVADSAIASGIALSSMPQIYTASGAVDDVCPPAAIAMLGHQDRAWLLAGDGHTLWASKALSDDPTVAPGFNEALTLYFANAKTCLGALPGAIAALGEDSIDLVTGLGPDSTGLGSWGQQGIQTDLGCTSPRSLATIPQGLVYRSRRGIELLDTGLNITWIGEAIQDQLATYPNVTSAVVVSDKRHLRISVENDAQDAGRVLVYDYGRGVWGVWNYGFPVADAAVIAGTYTLLRYNGAVYQENDTSRDDGVYVESAVTLILTTNGPNTWQRLKHAQVLGTSATDHTLTMSIKRDFAADYEYEKTFESAGDVTTPGPLEKARITPPVQKGQSFVLRIADSAADDDDTTDAGTGPILESLAIWVQRKPGLARVSASRRG